MKKLSVISFVVLIGIGSNVLGGTYGGGSGEPDTPYLISDPNHMQEIGANVGDWGSHFKLVNDIDLSRFTGTEFNIIGNDANAFTGVFDGDGQTISNFTFAHTSSVLRGVGIFGHASGTIKNVGLINPDVSVFGSIEVGTLAGHIMDANIYNCYAENIFLVGSDQVGGLIGHADNSSIIESCNTSGYVAGTAWYSGGLIGRTWGNVQVSYCYSTCNVWSLRFGGGLLGSCSGSIDNCYATGNLLSGSYMTGGLIGWACYTGTISNCYATGNILGDDQVGGLIGRSQDKTITNCYAVGNVTGNTDVAGLIGTDVGNNYSKCFWDNVINPTLNGIGNSSDPNVIAKSTIEMQTLSTFAGAGWDFGTPIWKYYTGCYPKLAWEPDCPIGDLNCDGVVDMRDFAIFASHWLVGIE